MKPGSKNKWLKALESAPAKLTASEKKKLMALDRTTGVDDRYIGSSLCIKGTDGIFRQGGFYD